MSIYYQSSTFYQRIRKKKSELKENANENVKATTFRDEQRKLRNEMWELN